MSSPFLLFEKDWQIRFILFGGIFELSAFPVFRADSLETLAQSAFIAHEILIDLILKSIGRHRCGHGNGRGQAGGPANRLMVHLICHEFMKPQVHVVLQQDFSNFFHFLPEGKLERGLKIAAKVLFSAGKRGQNGNIPSPV